MSFFQYRLAFFPLCNEKKRPIVLKNILNEIFDAGNEKNKNEKVESFVKYVTSIMPI